MTISGLPPRPTILLWSSDWVSGARKAVIAGHILVMQIGNPYPKGKGKGKAKGKGQRARARARTKPEGLAREPEREKG